MKTVAKIDPEKEYENAKNLIEQAAKEKLDIANASSLGSSVDNLITAARVLMDREERRRGKKRPPKKSKPKGRNKGESREDSKKLPSVRFPDIEIKEETVKPEHPPICPCCSVEMKESGLFDISEKLEVIPKQYYILRTKKVKFNCGNCHGALINTPSNPSIVPLSNYGDSFILDVTLSKFCDLIPIERYVQMAYRSGLEGLPAQSLIGLTHHLANFFQIIYLKIKVEALIAIVLQADETTHKMLEGDETYNWYLWGFFSQTACYFETQNTRSGDVVIEFLKESNAEYLVTDGYSGYGRAVREIKKDFNREIIEIHCNAHAYRYIEEASETWKEECLPLLELYGDIYNLERQRKNSDQPAKQLLEYREKMIPIFEQLKNKCEITKANAMPKSSLLKAVSYFLNHYNGLTRCTTNIDIPLDNNLSERELRSPVVGRKTWYGTHSKRGAETMAIHFSIVQTCKLNGVNPRHYYPWVTERIHQGKEILTPSEYAMQKDSS